MELFNKLEDVISFVLTGYGKEQLATGTFNPVYYAFSDSDILYDTSYAPISIADGSRTTPASASQNRTIEELYLKDRPKPSTFPDVSDNDFGDNFFKVGLIGSSEYGNNLYPAFEVKLYDGRISGSAYISGTYLNQNIPTINVNMQCKYDPINQTFIKHETLFLEINELNGLFEKENFEYSILRRYEPIVRTGPIPLFSYIPDELLEFTDREEVDENEEFPALDILPDQISNKKVEYWFDIDVDEKITELLDFEISSDSNIYLRPENVEPRPENC